VEKLPKKFNHQKFNKKDGERHKILRTKNKSFARKVKQKVEMSQENTRRGMESVNLPAGSEAHTFSNTDN